MSESSNYIEALEKIKKELHRGGTSVLVGAGFSKNINHSAFPDWRELLRDIVFELFEHEIKLLFDSTKFITEEEFDSYCIDYYLNKVGITQIVTMYEQKKGYGEAITTYIEERMPWIDDSNSNDIFLCKGNNSPERINTIKELDLIQHRLLVNLPWNNIYTTNYDNCLEYVISQSDIQSSLNTLLDELRNDLTSTNDKIVEVTDSWRILGTKLEEYSFIVTLCTSKRIGVNSNEIYNQLQNIIIPYDLYLNISNEIERKINVISESGENSTKNIKITILEKYKNKAFESLDKEKTQFKINSAFINEYQNYNEERSKLSSYILSLKADVNKLQASIDQLEASSKRQIAVVINSEDLNLRKSRNLIKLHGNLRRGRDIEKLAYGFDGDIRTQYIFSKDSYDTYPQKHEAFTNLMRISLLQEYFILIGFSGVDPNFTEWIKWVRDIIEVKKDQKGKPIKIYLIDVNSEVNLSEDLKLYYDNHSIAVVPLMHPDVLKFLENNTPDNGNSIKTGIKNAFCSLFRYLGKSMDALDTRISVNNYLNSYFKNILQYGRIDADNLIKLHNKLVDKNFRLINLHLRVGDIEYLITKLNDMLYIIKGKQGKKNSNAIYRHTQHRKSMLLGILELCLATNLPLELVLHTENLRYLRKSVVKNTDLYSKNTQKMDLLVGKNNSNFSQINKAYYYAYSFQFTKLEEFIEKWKPQNNEEKLVHSAFSYFCGSKKNDIETAYKIYSLKEVFEQEKDIYIYRQYLDLVRTIFNRLYLESPDNGKQQPIRKILFSIDSELNYLERGGILKERTIFEQLEKDVEVENKMPKYGEERFSTHPSKIFSNRQPKSWWAYRYLFSINEYSTILFYTQINSVNWYNIVRYVYKSFPNPVLFYSLMRGEEKLLHQLSRDYVFVDNVDQVLKSLLKSYKELNENRLQESRKDNIWNLSLLSSIITFSGYLLTIVPSSIWESFWVYYWSVKKMYILSNEYESRKESNFISLGLPYITSLSINILIADILDFLCSNGNVDENTVKSLFVTLNDLEITLDATNQQKLTSLIENVIFKKNKYWFVIETLYEYVDSEKLKSHMDAYDFSIENTHSYELTIIALKIFQHDPVNRDKLEKIIFNPIHLWYSGWKKKEGGRWAYTSGSFIFYLPQFEDELLFFIKNKVDSVKKLFLNLKDTLSSMLELVAKKGFGLLVGENFKQQTRNMLFFLNHYKAFENNKDKEIQDCINKIVSMNQTIVEDSEILSNLISSDKFKYNDALENLDYLMIIAQKDFNNFNMHINLIFGRLFSVDRDVFESSLGYLNRWVVHLKSKLITLYKEELCLLLFKLYIIFEDESYPDNIEAIYILEKCACIAVVLDIFRVGKTDIELEHCEYIEKWIDKAQKLNFNRVIKDINDLRKNIR